MVALGLLGVVLVLVLVAVGSRPRAAPGDGAGPAPERRIPPAVEALVYAGGVLLAVGAAMLVARFWDRMGTGGHLAVMGGATVLTGVVGEVVGEADPVAERLRAFVWVLSAVGAGVTAGLFVYEVLDGPGEAVACATAGGAALVSLGFWRLGERPLQHVVTFVGLAVTVGEAIWWFRSGNVWAVIGATLWLLGFGWVLLARWDRLPPKAVGIVSGIMLTLLASGLMAGRNAQIAPVVGLVTACAWLTIGIRRDAWIVIAPGVVGLLVYLPWTLGKLFGDTLGAPVVVMTAGALLLVVVLVLLRRRPGTERVRTRGPTLRRPSGPRR